MDNFFKYFMPIVFIYAFVQNVVHDQWMTAFWVALAAGWYALYSWSEYVRGLLSEELGHKNLTDYSK
jgi:hypothetical protein